MIENLPPTAKQNLENLRRLVALGEYIQAIIASEVDRDFIYEVFFIGEDCLANAYREIGYSWPTLNTDEVYFSERVMEKAAQARKILEAAGRFAEEK